MAAAYLQIQKLEVQLTCQGRWQKPTSQTEPMRPPTRPGTFPRLAQMPAQPRPARMQAQIQSPPGRENPAAFLRLQVYRILPGQHWMLRRSRLTMRSWRLVCSTKKVSALRPPMRICWHRHIKQSPATMASCSGSAVTITR